MGLTEIEGRITGAVDAIAPSVAVVESTRVGRHRARSPFLHPAEASAVVVDPAGFLVTNQHVVEGATQLKVRLADGREFPGDVVGGDEVTDVALVSVEANDLPAARLGASEALRVGQIVLAVGNALGLPGGPTVSMGLVSALGRPLPGSDFIFEGLIQTDAAINPGNSGGPLVDLSGSVVGINAAMVPFAQGVGFAIPIHAVSRIVDELRHRGRIVRPWIGVTVAELRPELARAHGLEAHSGLLVAEVVPRSPAHRAGLKAGDVIARVGPFPTRSVRDLLESLSGFPVGSDVELAFQRRGQAMAASVPLQERPEAEAPRP
ncbi:MAG TPA: trypsin-like peptidase domain-containing protein [Thermoplasmata archaeon]|nr:trypsin-like peptidase domain-containing protein [Thermoplasmata archaeon]